MSTAPLIYDLTKGEQQELYRLFDDERLKQYFQPSKHSAANESISAYYTRERALHIDQLIQQGAVKVASHREDIEQYLEPTRVTKEEQVTFDLRAKREQIDRQLNYLRLQIGQPPRSPNSIANSSPMQEIRVLSKAEHSSIVGKLLKERNEREKRHSELLQQTITREEEQERERQLKKQRMQSEEKEQKRMSIEKNIQEQKQKHEQFLRREKESAVKCQEIKERKFLHQQIEERYEKQVLLPNLEEKKKQLKNLREMKALNMDDLHRHEKEYLQRKQQSANRKDTIVPKYHYEAPTRSSRLEGILEDERMSRILKLEEKKKRIDEKLSRQQNFVAYLQDKFIPRIDEAKREEIEERMKKISQGKLECRDHRMLGIGYLQESKRRRKAMKVVRPQSENATVSVDSKDISSRAMTNYLSDIREKDVNYEGRRRKQLARLINAEEVSPQEKISRLQRESEKLTEHMGRHQKILKYQKDERVQKEALEMLLSNIQAKMGIIEMYQ